MAAVVAYHLDAPWMTGGFLGVDLFMVLSGFLITRLLIAEVDRRGAIDLRAFWVRRAKRLLPAALTMIVVVTALARQVFEADQMQAVRWDAVAAAFYVANWRFVLANTGYFDLFSEASPVRHLWSLAIEEQFYLLWPVVVFGLRRRQSILIGLTAGLVSISALLMVVTSGGGDPSRAYYGTDTRVQTLLVGCLLAMVLHRQAHGAAAERLTSLLAPTSLVVLLIALVVVDDSDRWMYRGGFLVFAALAATLVGLVVTTTDGWLIRTLEWRPLVVIGKGSYSIYLWHWPAIVFLSPERLGWSMPAVLIVRLLVTGVAAFVSYRWIEAPIRHGRFAPRTVLAAVGASSVFTIAAIGVLTANATAPAGYFNASGEVITAAPIASEYSLFPSVSNAIPESSSPAPVRPSILVLGDSVAASLGDGLLASAAGRGVALAAAPVSGCGLLPGMTLDGTTRDVYEPSRRCEATVDAAISAAFGQTLPTVVVWISVWDAVAREVNGVIIDPSTLEGQGSLAMLVDERVQELAATGATVVLVTNPPTGASGRGPAPSAQEQAHTTGYDSVLTEYAAGHEDVILIDLATHVCPNGAPCEGADPAGSPYRPTDGIHYEGEPSRAIADWLVGAIVDQLDSRP